MAITGRDALRRDTAQVFGDADARARRSSDDEVYVSGLYASPAEADRAYQHLRDTYGYDDGDIDVLMSDETRRQHYGNGEAETEPTGGTKAAEGLGAGSAIGGTVGAALGALFAVGSSMVIPGIGLVVAGRGGRRRRDGRAHRCARRRRHPGGARGHLRTRHQRRRRRPRDKGARPQPGRAARA
jgi:hypothetical protein